MKIMAVLVAAMMIMATMVPAWASSPTTGRIEETDGTPAAPKGSITINNISADEDYTVWRMFELASFMDTNTAAGVHIVTGANPQDEAYSYVIREDSPWYEWLTKKPNTSNPYAKVITSGGDDSTPVTGQLFWIENAPITIDGQNDYHVIYAVSSQFKNSADLPTDDDTNAAATTDYLDSPDAIVIQRFAQEAVKWAKGDGASTLHTKGYDPVLATRAPTADEVTAGIIELTGLKLGYYLMGTTQGTLCSLDTTNNSVDIYEKNQKASLDPSVGKKVLDKGTEVNMSNVENIMSVAEEKWVKNRDAKIGDTIYFRTQITAKQGAKNYVLHDVMEPGLSFDKSTGGKIELVTLSHTSSGTTTTWVIPDKVNTVATGDPVYTNNWSCRIPTGTAPNSETDCDFEIHFVDEMLMDKNKVEHIILDDDVITVYYSSQVTENAVMFGTDTVTADVSSVKTFGTTGSNGTKIDELPTGRNVEQVHTASDGDGRNTNSTILTFGKNSVTSDWSKATVTVYQFEVVKTRAPQDPATKVHSLLADAEFSLFRATKTAPAGTPTPYTFGDGASNTYYKDGSAISFVYDDTSFESYKYNGFAKPASDGATTTLTSMAGKELNLNGLDAGTYLLFEDKAPTGFYMLANPILIVIAGGNSDGTDKDGEGKITVTTKDNNNKVSTPVTYEWNAVLNTGSNPANTYDTAYKYGTGDAISNGGLEIINKAGQELPSTGGMGTTVLYIVGGMLVILAGAYLFFSRKRTA